jgi:hypothetical protein
MRRHGTVAHRILDAVRHHPGIRIDELALTCSDFTWYQIFVAVGRLSQRRQLKTISMGNGVYSVRLPSNRKRTLRP